MPGILGSGPSRLRGVWAVQNQPMQDLRSEIAAMAARMVVEDGLDYGSAKRRAARDCGTPARAMLPDNQQIEHAVREHLSLFHADTQPQELLALRGLALVWMERLADFRPHVCGAVWNGTATSLSGIHLELFCDDAKFAQITLVNKGFSLEAPADSRNGRDEVSTVSFIDKCEELGSDIDIFLSIKDYDMLRAGTGPARQGRPSRGDAAQLRRLMKKSTDA